LFSIFYVHCEVTAYFVLNKNWVECGVLSISNFRERLKRRNLIGLKVVL